MTEAVDFVVQQLEVERLMQVSASKSKVLAGRPSLAAAVAEGIATGRLSIATHYKLRGTDSNVGRRRSTLAFTERIHTFTEAVPKIHWLREAGGRERVGGGESGREEMRGLVVVVCC